MATAAIDTTTTWRRSRRFVVLLLTLLVVHAVTVEADRGDRRRRSIVGGDGVLLRWRERRTPGPVREGPPIKPEHFRSVAELNKYLAELNEYYTVLGRPRSVRFCFCLRASLCCATPMQRTFEPSKVGRFANLRRIVKPSNLPGNFFH